MSCCEVESQAESSRRGSCRKVLAREANASERRMTLNQAQITMPEPKLPTCCSKYLLAYRWLGLLLFITLRTHTSRAALTETFETRSKTARRVDEKRFPVPVCPRHWPTELGNQALLSNFPSGRRLGYQTQAERRILRILRNGKTLVPECLKVGGGKGTRIFASICVLTLIAA